ncbi:HNH endonuclease family protein [Neolewinella antarctica]|uniref:Uncharacterized protein (TIGR02646 family) n=1 Tax=Neolewinella antarctica TaxID=442734 RepID=A0ABX0X9M1_9BACT|nr:hypothetical protein [Neolewinella antarctica]NJC25678.1 uncharacterized protein (TIGR02646 family) [Neolewinella antarctica]
MRLIIKSTEPTVLTTHRASGGTYEELSAANGKDDIKEQLLAEQSNCCAYCTSRIRLAKTKLEHWHPQSVRPPDRRLDYTNMLACCTGMLYVDGTPHFHCDTSKGDTKIYIKPHNGAHIATLAYGFGDGSITASFDRHQTGLDSPAHLNLNHREHKRRRRLALTTFQNAHLGRNKKPNFAKLLSDYMAARRPYEDIIIAYIKDKIRRG